MALEDHLRWIVKAAQASLGEKPFVDPPRRPARVVNKGVPRATASRFIVPPAETNRSAQAIKL